MISGIMAPTVALCALSIVMSDTSTLSLCAVFLVAGILLYILMIGLRANTGLFTISEVSDEEQEEAVEPLLTTTADEHDEKSARQRLISAPIH